MKAILKVRGCDRQDVFYASAGLIEMTCKVSSSSRSKVLLSFASYEYKLKSYIHKMLDTIGTNLPPGLAMENVFSRIRNSSKGNSSHVALPPNLHRCTE